MKIRHSTGRLYVKTGHGQAELRYDIEDSVMRIYHTYVPEADRGRGIAEELTKAAFKFAKSSNMKVDPECPYVVHFVERNKQYQKDSVRRQQ